MYKKISCLYTDLSILKVDKIQAIRVIFVSDHQVMRMRTRIILGRRTHIRTRMRVKTWIHIWIRIKVKIKEFRGSKSSHGGIETHNGAVEGCR
jgi:hypothetical protein